MLTICCIYLYLIPSHTISFQSSEFRFGHYDNLYKNTNFVHIAVSAFVGIVLLTMHHPMCYLYVHMHTLILRHILEDNKKSQRRWWKTPRGNSEAMKMCKSLILNQREHWSESEFNKCFSLGRLNMTNATDCKGRIICRWNLIQITLKQNTNDFGLHKCFSLGLSWLWGIQQKYCFSNALMYLSPKLPKHWLECNAVSATCWGSFVDLYFSQCVSCTLVFNFSKICTFQL